MPRKPTQPEQLLAMLEEAGPNGVHSFTARRAFIGNPSERIRELRELGHQIRTGDRERLHGEAWGVRWFLIAKASPTQLDGGPAALTGSSASIDHGPAPASSPPGGAPQDLPLFEVPAPAPRSALLEDEAA